MTSDQDEARPVSVLLVEDNPDDAELALRVLRKQRVYGEIQVVADGQAAIDLIFGPGGFADLGGPKAVLLDLNLPSRNGLEVLAMMRGSERTARIPVVMLTSSVRDWELVESYRLGVNDYIVKPVRLEALEGCISELALYWHLMNGPPIDSRDSHAAGAFTAELVRKN